MSEIGLLNAARYGNKDEVLKQLTNGANVNGSDRFGWTPLHYASHGGRINAVEALSAKGGEGHIDVVEALLAKGANVNAKNNYGRTPLHCASYGVHMGVAEALIANGADVDAKDTDRNTPLHEASINGHIDVVEALIANGADVNGKDNHGWTPLHKASREGHIDVVEALLAKGADIDAVDIDANTPLIVAKSRGNDSVANLLEAAHAKQNAPILLRATNQNQEMTLNGVDESKHENIRNAEEAEQRHDKLRKTEELLNAARYGNKDEVLKQLTNGANVNAKDKYGWTPLHYASYDGIMHVTEALIANGADVNGKDNHGWTPLHKASREGHIDVVAALLAKGADIDAVDIDANTPLDAAKSRGNDSVANLLEAAHAEQNALILLRATNQNQEMTLNGVDESKHENIRNGEEAEQKHDKLPDEDCKDKKAGISNTPNQVQFELTDEDLHFLKMGRELVRDEWNIEPAISIEDRSTLRALTAQMVDIERSLESVRELPPSLSDREPEVAEYFFSFTNAFARAFTAAQALSSGAVKCDVEFSLQSLLGGASWVAENCKLPFFGCVSVFSAIILHQQETKKTNTFMAFEEFFRGNSRDQYLVTYRKLAETFCLQLDISLLNGDNPGKAGRLKEQVHTKIVAPIEKYLRKVHLNTIQELSPVGAKAMTDLSSLTKEVLRLHRDDHLTYHELRTSNECVKASYFVEHIFGEILISPHLEQKPSTNDTIQNSSWKRLADQNQSHSTEDEARLQHLLEEIEKMKEQMKEQSLTNANMAATNTNMQAQLRKLVEKVKSEKDLTVPSGNQVQMQMNPNKSKEGALQLGQDFNYAQIEQDIRQLQLQQEKHSQDAEKMKLENFINNRVLSYREAFELTHRILSIADHGNGSKIEVSEDGWFVLHGKKYCIGTVCKGRLISKKRTLWKGKVGIKLEEEHRGVKSIMDWFDETKLRPRYERNKKQAIRIMFADELDVEPVLHVVAQPQAQYDRDKLFDTDIGSNLR